MQAVEGSTYRSALLTPGELKTLLGGDGPSTQPHIRRTTDVYIWPRHSETLHRISRVALDVDDPKQGEHPAKLPLYEMSRFNGFLGLRYAGKRLQLRVEADCSYERPDGDVVPTEMPHPMEAVSGKIFYEGDAPQPDGSLMFTAPLGENAAHVVLVRVVD